MLKQTLYAVASTLMLLSSQSLANSLILAHAPHPAIKSIYIPILEEVYSELGIELEFQEMSTLRGLVEANARRVDGDVARFAEALHEFPDLIKVPTALDRAEIILLCIRQVDCSKAALRNAENHIVIPTETAVVRRLVATYPAKFSSISHSLEKAQELLSLGRYEYALYVSSELFPHQVKTEEYNLNWVVLESFPLYHVLHKSHQGLADKVSLVLPQVLERFHSEKQDKQ